MMMSDLKPLETLKIKRKKVEKEIEELTDKLEEKRNELYVLDKEIAGIEGVPRDVENIRKEAENFTKDKKKRPRPSYENNFNWEQGERTKKRLKEIKISKEKTQEISSESSEESNDNGNIFEVKRVEKGKKLDKIIEELNMVNERGDLDEIIEHEKKINNEQQVETRDLVTQLREIEFMTGLVEKTNQIEILKRYNYAESFRIRIRKEIEKGLEDQTARTKVYKEITEIMGKEYKNLKKMTQEAEKLYRIVKEAGGKKIIRNLKVTKMSTLLKLTREQILYIIGKLEK